MLEIKKKNCAGIGFFWLADTHESIKRVVHWTSRLCRWNWGQDGSAFLDNFSYKSYLNKKEMSGSKLLLICEL